MTFFFLPFLLLLLLDSFVKADSICQSGGSKVDFFFGGVEGGETTKKTICSYVLLTRWTRKDYLETILNRRGSDCATF